MDLISRLRKWPISSVSVSLVESKGEARRLISQGAVEIDGVRVAQNSVPIRDDSVIQVGKRRYVKLVR